MTLVTKTLSENGSEAGIAHVGTGITGLLTIPQEKSFDSKLHRSPLA
jgi:hypothetical protein